MEENHVCTSQSDLWVMGSHLFVEALAVQLTQREGELIQEKAEVKKLANFLKQASEDAKKLVDEERVFARAEIEGARAAVQRVEEALQDHERMSQASGKQDLEQLMKEVQEARRIKMLHQPSKVPFILGLPVASLFSCFELAFFPLFS
ncbi:hypothetical protein VNO78_24266 [Psophocarpus tetragonolobus]|uniref:Stomatal closure-related actin-binding protein coiled-coil domain-containing protein n=1 Tax=Psophocarpus tetragonolobus TaxID=3891 RepID=A0AAN9S5J3_PSOTE